MARFNYKYETNVMVVGKKRKYKIRKNKKGVIAESGRASEEK